MTARNQALAFRIWQYANAREWNCTLGEIAAELDCPVNAVRAIAQHRGWLSRLRCISADQFTAAYLAGVVSGESTPRRINPDLARQLGIAL